MLHVRQTLLVRIARNTQKIQSSDWPKWRALWGYIISSLLSEHQTSFPGFCRYISSQLQYQPGCSSCMFSPSAAGRPRCSSGSRRRWCGASGRPPTHSPAMYITWGVVGLQITIMFHSFYQFWDGGKLPVEIPQEHSPRSLGKVYESCKSGVFCHLASILLYWHTTLSVSTLNEITLSTCIFFECSKIQWQPMGTSTTGSLSSFPTWWIVPLGKYSRSPAHSVASRIGSPMSSSVKLPTNQTSIIEIYISRAWCKTIVTTSFYIRSYNSFAPSPRFAVYYNDFLKIKIVWL